MLKRLQLLAILVTLPIFGQAIRVSGIVRSNGGTPVPGATVRVVQPSTGKGWVSWTDEAGKFDMTAMPAGKLRFEVQQLGFEQTSLEVEVAADSKPIELIVKVGGLPQATAAVPPAAAQSPAAPGARPRPGGSAPGPGGQRPAFAGARPGQQGQQPPARQPGFQQVDPTELQAALGQGGQETIPQIDAGPLGEAASSDAFLMSGSVGRGTTAGQDFSNFGPPGIMAMFGGPEGMPGGFGPGGMEGGAAGSNPFGGQAGAGGPGGPGGDRMAAFMGAGGGPGGGGPGGARGGGGGPGGGGGGGARGGGGGGRPGQAGQAGQQRNNPRAAANARQQGPQAMEGLWGMNRIMRMAANRTRFGFYERFGTSAWDARPYSLTAANPTKLSRIRQRAGLNIGGPLVIPKIYNGKEKTFYFLNYDFSRGRNPIDTFATVPTAAERAGDFSARGVQLFAPVAGSNVRTPLGSVIPASMISTASAGLLRFIPLPNLPGTVQNFHLQAKVPNSSDRINLRILHTINQKLNLQVTYGVNSSRSQSVQSFPLLQGRASSLGQNASVGLTQTYTPRFIHDSRIMWSRNATNSRNLYSGSDDIAGNLGITGISTDPVNYGVPQIGFTNYTGLNDPVPSFRRNQQFRITDSVTWAKQKYTFRAGIEFRRGQNNNRNDPTARGSFTFTGLQSSQLDAQGRPVQGTGRDFADFLMGLPYSTNVRFGNSSTYYRSYGLTAFVQEDWRIHPRFSVNVGLRYEFLPPATELRGHLANLDINSSFTQVALVTPGTPGPFSGNLPDSLIHSDKNNLAPRIGIAWRPNFMRRNTVIRAGYSMFYNGSVYDRLITSMANQPPFSQSQLRYTTAAQPLTLTNGFPPQPLGTVNNTIAIDPNYRVGYAQIWNLTLETPVMRNLILDLTYTGTKGTGLDLLRSPNRAIVGTDLVRRIPNAAAFTYDQSGAMSIYHAGQVRLQKRMSRGIMVGGTYTFSKSLDNASSIGGGAQIMVQDDTNFAAERGRSSFDIRHQFRSNFNWELPFGERRKWMSTGKRAAFFGSWSINGSVTANSGTPYTARMLGTASNNSGSGNNFSERPDAVSNPSLSRDQRTPLHFFNVAAFALPPSGRFGNASRNTITGPGVFSVEASIGKSIRLGRDRQRRLDLRWEFSNLLNHPNYTGLNTVINSSNAGRVQGARAMRTIDFQARFNF